MKKIIKGLKLEGICTPITDFELGNIIFGHLSIAAIDSKDCAGLAAPQIGYNFQVFIVRFSDYKNCYRLFINPSIDNYFGGEKAGSERSLGDSIGAGKTIWRYNKIILTWQDLRGAKHTRTYKNFIARVMQHQFDTLQGITIHDRYKTYNIKK